MAWDFVVAKSNLRQGEFRAATRPDLAEGEVRLAVDSFALTANNITYAVFGEAMRYWDFFPAAEGFGRVPVWGFATVEASSHPDIAVGQRFYGYYPMSSHLTVQPRKTRGGFADAAPHRQHLAAVYNQYTAVDAEDATEALRSLLQPLFITGFLIDDFLDDHAMFGAGSIILSSASSKTAIGLAFLLKQRGGAKVVGLTSARNVAFVEALGFYDQVVTYDDFPTAPMATPAVFVDFAGDAGVLGAVHRRFGDDLAYSCLVGGTHWEAARGAGDLPGPKPILFFAPDRVKKRQEDWGPGGFESRYGAAWSAFVADAGRWLKVENGVGQDAIAATYLAVLEGRAGPETGCVVRPG
jgi:NADPH:quinone reductase-like Zn-dependent oxidoreductase